ncbi:MAG: hypothetical protein GX589_05235 [Deltaproteobacteria bacterium]|nr:hypothetical protein [Deltaproteobacteria bacterium]
MAHIFKDMVQIREAQLVQIAPGGIIVRIVKGPEYSAQDEKKLVAEMQNRLGADITLDFDYVDAIPRTAAGKLRFVISEIDDGKLTGLLSS